MPTTALLTLLISSSATAGLSATEDIDSVVTLLEFVIDVDEDTASKCLATLRKRIESGEVNGQRLQTIRQQLGNKLQAILGAGADSGLFFDAAVLAAAWDDAMAKKIVHRIAIDQRAPHDDRVIAIGALAVTRDIKLLNSAGRLLRADDSAIVTSALLGAMAKYERPEVGEIVLQCYEGLAAELQPRAIELLTQRSVWSRQLLNAIGDAKLSASVLNINQVRNLLASPDTELVALVRSEWGEIRTERSPEREQVLRQMRDQLNRASGNPHRGQQVFNRVCGQCHKIYGTGQEVGPEITRNGRGSFDQLLSNVFDPSLVVGASYQARTVITADGRVLTGLLTENNEQRLVLKTQGGKLEVIPRDDVDEMTVSKLSLMPEGVEKQLKPQELADLFAFLVLDRPPQRADAALIPGTPKGLAGK